MDVEPMDSMLAQKGYDAIQWELVMGLCNRREYVVVTLKRGNAVMVPFGYAWNVLPGSW